jgi:uncharacterized RDD family membrane protein YckC
VDDGPDPDAIPPGTMLAHYRIGAVLGSGSMGTVYRAHDLGLDRGVAVKILKGAVAEDAKVVERFFREARAAARVAHENLTHVYFVGSEGARRFFAMEYVPGKNLEERVEEQGPLPLEEAVAALVQAARGLGAAHAAGVVHRDVKPSNLLRRPDGTVKVTDFGLARSVGGDLDASAAGQILGTPTFMSPEQVRGETADVRSDVYALGLTGYFLLAGHPPFPGPTLGKVLSDQLNAPLPSLVVERPELPPVVDEVLGRLCSKDPERRPRDMDAVLVLLKDLRPRRVERAPFAARGAALLLDVLLVALLVSAVMYPINLVFGGNRGDRGDGDLASVRWLLFHVAWAVSQLGGELWRQTSPGKWLLHLAVLREDGLGAAPKDLLLRFLVRSPQTPVAALMVLQILPWDLDSLFAGAALLAGTVWWFVNGGKTLSDALTKTTVAYRHPPSE